MSHLQLMEAVKAENLGVIEELLRSGADVNQQDEHGWTPLNWAAGKGNLAIVSLLVENGADVFKVGRDQRTPSMIALAAGHADVVGFLRQAEERAGGEARPRRQRPYCKAYHVGDLRQFPQWAESRINWPAKNANGQGPGVDDDHQAFSDHDIVYLHQDYTVTQSMWHNESVIFNHVTPEWIAFCADQLKFAVPDDLDLIATTRSTTIGATA